MCCTRLAEKYRTQKSPKIVIWAPSQPLSGYIFATKACIDNRKKNLLNSNTFSTCSDNYGELQPTSGWDLLVSLRYPCEFHWVSRLGSVTARHSGSGRQPNFAALNRGRHLCSAHGENQKWIGLEMAEILAIENFHITHTWEYVESEWLTAVSRLSCQYRGHVADMGRVIKK